MQVSIPYRQTLNVLIFVFIVLCFCFNSLQVDSKRINNNIHRRNFNVSIPYRQTLNRQREYKNYEYMYVSIPYRQTLNPFRGRCYPSPLCFNSLQVDSKQIHRSQAGSHIDSFNSLQVDSKPEKHKNGAWHMHGCFNSLQVDSKPLEPSPFSLKYFSFNSLQVDSKHCT